MTRFSSLAGPGLLALALLAGERAAVAQTPPPITCPQAKDGEELRDLPEIRADKGVLSTTFSVEMKQQCVPTSDSNGVVTVTSMPLRTYVYPDPVTREPRWGFPGPVLRIRKQEELPDGKGTTPGDRVKILLVNKLPPDTTAHGKCDDACAGTGVDCSTIGKLPTGAECAAAAGDPSHPRVLPGCCCLVNQNQTWPECFHGDNSTNLHFHGTHVSPQPPQDFVLLELRPEPRTELPAGASRSEHGTHTRGLVAYGQYQYDVDPPPPTQAEGTHWYHPHKHGSVSLQVANGMPGALIIEGAFDDWLRGFYGGRLKEKILVVQQVKQQTNLYNNPLAPPTLVNGQMNPTVTLQPGEVQRWRVVNATLEVGSQVLVTFPQGARVRQIAMDGVRFSPANYTTQPLCNSYDPCQVLLSPGNRADFLVEAPAQEGLHRITHSLARPGVVSPGKRLKLLRRDQALLQLEAQRLGSLKAAGDGANPALFTLKVQKSPAGEAAATGFPPAAQWPEMPWYLKDLPAQADGTKSLDFQMTAGPGDPTTQFKINGKQFDDNCAQVTTRLNTTDAWTIQNSSPLAHPFHIHINPFQLVEQGTMLNNQPVAFVKYESPIWQDTVALPVQNSTWDVEAGPIWNQQYAEQKCPAVCQAASGGTWSGSWRTTVPNKMSVCGCSYTGNGYVLLRHRYLDFTGEYVLHCHFLGHEDRGMMFSVQTVCKDDPTKFGKSTDYPRPECVEGNLIPAAPVCPAGASASGHGGH